MEAHWLKRAASPLNHKAGTRRATGDLEGCGSNRLQDLAAKNFLYFNCEPYENSFVTALHRSCMEITRKLAIVGG
eukprot:1161104-Pelagomonas_calceolata.AAC.4